MDIHSTVPNLPIAVFTYARDHSLQRVAFKASGLRLADHQVWLGVDLDFSNSSSLHLLGGSQVKKKVTSVSAPAGIQTLDLSECDQLDVLHALPVLQALPNLEHLNLTGCRKLDSRGLEVLCDAIASNQLRLSPQNCLHAATGEEHQLSTCS